MVRKSVCLLTAVSLLVLGCNSSKHSGSNRLPGMWQAAPIVVDGNNKDWPSPYPEYDDKAMLGYAVSNDKENLYISVETGDLATQLKILRNGLTVWIDRKGEKNEQVAINYPTPRAENKQAESETDRPARGSWQDGQGASRDKQRMVLEDRVKKMLVDANEYSLQGFKSCNLQFPIAMKDSCGIEVKMNIDADNEMVWEAVIPFRTFFFKQEITKADKGKPLTVIIETDGSKRPAGQGSGGGHGGGGGFRPGIGYGGMGGMGMGMRMGGGGPRGGGRAGSGQDNMMESLYKSTKTYKRFGIAFP